MKPERSKQTPEDVFAGVFRFFMVMGFVWFYAWILNPDITSGTVWFIGALVGSLESSIGSIRDRV